MYTAPSMIFTLLVALFISLVVDATPLPWDGGSSYSGASSPVNGGSVSGGGGINLIKVLSHNAKPAGDASTGPSWGGAGGNRFTGGGGKNGKGSTAGGSAGGDAYSGASGSATGGNAQTDPQLSVIDLLSDNAAPGGTSKSGPAMGGDAGSIF